MSFSQRKVNTAAFTNALKQVFYIHKNIVAELCAKLDVVSKEGKLLKASAHTPKRSEKCELCVHLEKVNRSLHEHFNRLLHEKDMDIKALELKLQALTGESNKDSSQRQNSRSLPKEICCFLTKEEVLTVKDLEFSPKNSGITQHPPSNCKDTDAVSLEKGSQGETGNLNETELSKGHHRLRLTRQGKRHIRYSEVEEQRETKRVKISPPASEKEDNASVHKVKSKRSGSTGLNDGATGLNDNLFVPDTDCTTQQRKLNRPTLQYVCSNINKDDEADSDHDQSQQILVVPETLAVDISSNSGYEDDVELDEHDNANDGVDNGSQKKPLPNNEKEYNNVRENFLDFISGKNYKENVHTLKASNVKDFCGPVLKESLNDVCNNDQVDSVSCSKRHSNSVERKFESVPSRKQSFQDDPISACDISQSSGEKKGNLEELSNIDEGNLVLEGSPRQHGVRSPDTPGSVSPTFFGEIRVKKTLIPLEKVVLFVSEIKQAKKKIEA